jgi:hypothetical protein
MSPSGVSGCGEKAMSASRRAAFWEVSQKPIFELDLMEEFTE